MTRIFSAFSTNVAVLAVFGFAGALISLALSKSIAKRTTSLYVIDRARSELRTFASMIEGWFCRYRGFRADRGSATLAATGNRVGAIEALQRSRETMPGGQRALPAQMRAFALNTSAVRGALRLFTSHPPRADRIAAPRTGSA
jgi:Zn-dependent protease with chaperone function